MTFLELKKKYKNHDLSLNDDSMIVIDGYILTSNGRITLSRTGYTALNEVVSTHVDIASDRTPEQMDLFLQGIM